MQPNGWIFYQGQHPKTVSEHAIDCRPWDLKFDRHFECTGITVSDPRYRQGACAVLASEKSAAFHFGLTGHQQVQGHRIYSTQLAQGYLILIFAEPSEPSNEAIRNYFIRVVQHFVKQECSATRVNERTRSIVKLTALGFTSKEIANALFLTSRGVDYHLELAKKQLGASNKSALVFLAMQQHWFA